MDVINNKSAKKLIHFAIGIIICTTIVYGVGTFSEMSFSPQNWPEQARRFLVVVWICLMAIISINIFKK